MELNPLKAISTPVLCWHALVPGFVISVSSFIPSRHHEKGLEVVFVVMCALAGVTQPVQYADETCLHSSSTLLFPIRRNRRFLAWLASHLSSGIMSVIQINQQ